MKPRDYLTHLQDRIEEVKTREEKEQLEYMLKGATMMWELCNRSDRAYREAHREELRTYNREYMRKRRAEKKLTKKGE